ncbi:hypothetical protein QBC40DRAFT_64973 [Triangularia verruculosa]|uniref:EamA domain-containing protein n=1 Tax=Triangularia verruculosa TaxID=2587418 RepID=A0AAN7AVT2_9PEZI|nr:hypothetical protein QBC40DRAFT_64973 [Triangularia verruculosa]
MRTTKPTRSGEQPLLSSYHSSDDEERGRRALRGGNRRGSPLPPTATTWSQTPTYSHFAASDLITSRPTLSRRSTNQLRSRSPTSARLEAKRKYTYAAFFLVTSLVSFVVQTELASHIQHDLGWDKAYAMLYLTHGSWVFLWPLQLIFLRLQRREQTWNQFWNNHKQMLRKTAQMVERQEVRVPRGMGADRSPWPYLVRTTAMVTIALTVAGSSWYVAVSMTTPSDLTAIYNCSAFFAYAFSVPLLKERLRLDKILAVFVAIIGVLVVAYGGGSSSDEAGQAGPATRFAGNIIIGIGSVLYGLYEVLYKRYACPPDGTSANRSMMFANTVGSLIGVFTVFVLWIPIPVLHILGWETFEIPTGETATLLLISVVANMVFSGSFLVLISLTSPVLSSVAALLTIFLVAIVDWFLTGQPLEAPAILGGLLIVVAFGMLSWSTWKEMNEEDRKAPVDLSSDSGDED